MASIAMAARSCCEGVSSGTAGKRADSCCCRETEESRKGGELKTVQDWIMRD